MNTALLSHRLPHMLKDCGAVKIDIKVGFKLKLHETNPEAPLSPIYLNLRTPENPKPGPLTPQMVTEIGRMLWKHAKAKGLTFDAVAGLPNAGRPLALAFHEAAFVDGTLLQVIQLGKNTTTSGRKIEGILENDGAIPGDIVLVIDDLITGGDSKKEGIEVLTNAGFVVGDVLVLIDREQGGLQDLQEIGGNLWSLMTLKKLVHLLFEAGKVSAAERERVFTYLGNS